MAAVVDPPVRFPFDEWCLRLPSQVYAGNGNWYGERTFVNGLEHRYTFVSYDKAGNVSPPVEAMVKASSLLLAPADGARVRAKQLALRWRAVGRAGFNNVQLWRGRHKILSTGRTGHA